MAQTYGQLVRDEAILELINHNSGHQLKQGDQTVLKYEIIDRDEDVLDLVGTKAKAVFLFRNEVVYQTSTVVEEGNIVHFTIGEILPARTYKLEIVVDGKYVFPSDQDAELEIVPSSIGALSEILETTPLDTVADFVAELSGGANQYIHSQDEASNEWVIQHQLGTHPVVDVLDENGQVVYGEVVNMSLNHTVIYFAEPVTGMAILK